jgi:fibroblast growth factor receptor 3
MSRATTQYNLSSKQIPYRWCAPEILLGEVANPKSDVFSFGVIMYEILTFGAIPYMDIISNAEVREYVIAVCC